MLLQVGYGSKDQTCLVKKQLAHVVDGALVPYQRVVGQDGGILVDNDVDVRRAGGVVAGEQELDLHHALVIGGPDGALERRVQDARVCAIAIATVVCATVDAGLVGTPELGVLVGDGLARVDVDDLYIQSHVDSMMR